MAILSANDSRPPYVQFEMRDIEDRDASIAAGHYVGKSVAYAIITRPGDRDSLEKPAEDWLKELKEKGRQGQIPPTWFPAFTESYKSWLSGETAEVQGTPIKGWTMLGAAAQKTLLAAGIQSVEDLAEMPDGDLERVGTGAMSFKMKAKAYLEAANGPGKQAEKMAALQTQMAELITLTKNQAVEIQNLRAQIPQTAEAKKF